MSLALAAIKNVGPEYLDPRRAFLADDSFNLRERFGAWMVEKGFEPEAILSLASLDRITSGFGYLVDGVILGNLDASNPRQDATKVDKERIGALSDLAMLGALSVRNYNRAQYTGTDSENANVDAAFTGDRFRSSGPERLRHIRNNGASRVFHTGQYELPIDSVPDIDRVPIGIVGAGAAGILTARALTEIGFKNLVMWDKRGRHTGIWGQDNVRNGSKNNPFNIRFMDTIVGPANGRGTPDGIEIERFLRNQVDPYNFGYRRSLRDPVKAVVTEIEPGDLSHRVHYKVSGAKQADSEVFPIVVYAPGIGLPLDPNRKGYMATLNSRGDVGKRWQEQLSSDQLRELAGKRVIFVGIGNSTFEMIPQLEDANDNYGYNIDYRIITHLPPSMIHNPRDRRRAGNEVRSLYRDLNRPNLTSLAGDLPVISAAFRSAVVNNRIITGARLWHHDRNVFSVLDENGIETTIPFDKLYTLIGYGNAPDALEAAGMKVQDEYTGTIYADYDGETQANPGAVGRERVNPGLFANGSVLKTRRNPNALVIPGIQARLNDMIPSIVIRAAEYCLRKGQQAS